MALSRANIARRVRELRNDPTIPDDFLDRLLGWAYAWSGGCESEDTIVHVICARLHLLVGRSPK